MAASTAAAHEAAAASHWSWLRGYEARVAAGQDWPGPGARGGGDFGGQQGVDEGVVVCGVSLSN